MRINKDSLKARVNNIAHQLNISQNTIYNRFFFDAFLSRLAISKYNEKFILKGGLYLSSLLGIESRSTIDIDFYLKKIRLEKGILFKVIQEILNTSIDDGINFQIVKIEDRINNVFVFLFIKSLPLLNNILLYLHFLDNNTYKNKNSVHQMNQVFFCFIFYELLE